MSPPMTFRMSRPMAQIVVVETRRLDQRADREAYFRRQQLEMAAIRREVETGDADIAARLASLRQRAPARGAAR